VNQPRKRFLSIPEIVLEYGGSEGFWRKRVFRKEISYNKFGKAVRIDRGEVEGFIDKRKVAAQVQIS
jgi:hypothetical protein